MIVRGIRGAITAQSNTQEEILEATRALLTSLLANNPSLRVQDIASAWFTCTQDLDAVYPARAARELGWLNLPMMCAQEMYVEGGISKCIRVLLHWNTSLAPEEIQHTYLREAVRLRPDWVLKNEESKISGGVL